MSAKKAEVVQPLNQLTVVRYEFDGIKVYVETNYVTGKISLVEPTSMGGYKPKQYLFAGREIEYMNGWLNILVGLGKAINAATEELQKYQSDRKNEKFQSAVNLAASIIDKKEKK